MALIQNFVLETCNAPGTSATINLAGAPAGRRTFSSTFSSGATVYYFMDDGTQAEWGSGVFTSGSPNTLTRSVIGNTNGSNIALNFSGTVRVYCDVPAERLMTADVSPWQLISTQTFTSGSQFVVAALPAAYSKFQVEYDITSDNSISSTGQVIMSLQYSGGTSTTFNYTATDGSSVTSGSAASTIPLNIASDGAWSGRIEWSQVTKLVRGNCYGTLGTALKSNTSLARDLTAGAPLFITIGPNNGNAALGTKVRLLAAP